MNPIVRRGDIYFADLSPVVGSEQGGLRPVLIIQNDVGNRHAPTVIVAAITTEIKKLNQPTHVYIGAKFGLEAAVIPSVKEIVDACKATMYR